MELRFGAGCWVAVLIGGSCMGQTGYRNIQVLKDVPGPELLRVMSFMRASLGVRSKASISSTIKKKSSAPGI